ncbi:glycosyltransferase [Salinicoccus kekensis]|uniref:Glycosyl transferase family 1 n=1 Tax=Salinicoccus kekensis TaxID=714307 RepID=A0A285USC6_9STAP|nr:glycosyltransferase [Salinicoccus kekensis]SOC44719.1 glycosyl transferase family 1 [Salinicoccus kekensis]
MKILFVLNNFNIGGPQKSLLSLLHNFPEDSEIDLLVLNGQTPLKKYLPKNVNLRTGSTEVNLLMMEKRGVLSNIVKTFLKNPKLSYRAISTIIKTILKRKSFTTVKQEFWKQNKDSLKQECSDKYDLAVGASGGHSMMYIVDFVRSKYKVGWVRTEYQNLRRNLQIDEYYFNELNRVLSVSNKCTEKFSELFPEQAFKCITFYNALPFKMYSNIKNKFHYFEKKDEYILVTISRLDKDKGFDLLIGAARILKEKNVDFTWFIYGEGPMKNYIAKEIKKYKLDKYILLKGFVFNTGEILRNSDALVHPSKFEGKSNTLDEAKYYQVPIVSTNFPTVQEQLHQGVTGIITDLNAESLANGIYKLLNNQELRSNLSKNLEKEKQSVEKRDVYQEFITAIRGASK